MAIPSVAAALERLCDATDAHRVRRERGSLMILETLQARGWPVAGVFVGGCVKRGVGSSFRAAAHTHTRTDPLGWICIRSAKRVLTPSGAPSRLLLHEVAHVLAPKASHGSAAFIAALREVGIQTDSYSQAGRKRASR